MIGASGSRKIVVECVGMGVQSIRMVYVRSWEFDGFETCGEDDNLDSHGNPCHRIELMCLKHD